MNYFYSDGCGQVKTEILEAVCDAINMVLKILSSELEANIFLGFGYSNSQGLWVSKLHPDRGFKIFKLKSLVSEGHMFTPSQVTARFKFVVK